MPESQAEKLREHAEERGAPDPVEQDGERIERAEAGIAAEEARENGR